MKCLFLFTCLLLAPSLALASPQEELIARRMAERLPHDVLWSLAVVDLKSGRGLVNAGNTAQRLIPASLMKLFIAGAVLERTHDGKAISLDTEILHDGRFAGGTIYGNVYLRGSGNCLLSAAELRNLAQRLRQKGIVSITGGVVADDIRFDSQGLERNRKGAGYAPVSALGLDLHTVRITATPEAVGKPVHVNVIPANPYNRLAVTARCSGSGKSTFDVGRIDDNSYRVSGDMPNDSSPQSMRFALSDPALYAAQSFTGILADTGIKVEKGPVRGRAPAGATMLGKVPGPESGRLVTEMNINSLNVAADNLLLALGRGSAEIGTREKGVAALREHLARHGMSGEAAIVVDGAGLNPANAVTAGGVARYLASAARAPWFGTFKNSLPRAGMDGTLRGAEFRSERFRAKSGNLENVTSLAGYGVNKSGQEIAFALIVNTPGPLIPNVRNIGDVLMRFLAEQR